MLSTLLCLLLFGIITLIHASLNYVDERAAELIPKLSNLKGKYGLNFANSEGIGSLPKHYKKSHPQLTYKDHNPQIYNENNKPAAINNIEIYKRLVAAKLRDLGRSRDRHCSEADENKREVLRIFRKKPKEFTEINCRPKIKNECGVSSESEETNKSDSENNSKQRKRFSKKKRYFRTDDNMEHKTVDKTALLLDDLEKLLSGNGKYRVSLSCIGRLCGGRTSRIGYDEGGDDTEVRRENLGCIGDGCGRNGDDDNDADVRRI